MRNDIRKEEKGAGNVRDGTPPRSKGKESSHCERDGDSWMRWGSGSARGDGAATLGARPSVFTLMTEWRWCGWEVSGCNCSFDVASGLLPPGKFPIRELHVEDIQTRFSLELHEHMDGELGSFSAIRSEGKGIRAKLEVASKVAFAPTAARGLELHDRAIFKYQI